MGQRSIRRLMGEILFASEAPQVRTALLCDVVADRSAQHRIAGLDRVEDQAQRGLALDRNLYVAANTCQGSQVLREHNSDHISLTQTVSGPPQKARPEGLRR